MSVTKTRTPTLEHRYKNGKKFSETPVSEILLGFKEKSGQNVQYIRLDLGKTFPSLMDLFKSHGNNFVPSGSDLGSRDEWKAWIGPKASLQRNCNRIAINNYHHYARVRLGIISNQEGNCHSPDSRIGVGGRGHACGQNNNNAAGTFFFRILLEL